MQTKFRSKTSSVLKSNNIIVFLKCKKNKKLLEIIPFTFAYFKKNNLHFKKQNVKVLRQLYLVSKENKNSISQFNTQL